MANAIYHNQKPLTDILNVRTFSVSEGRSVELSRIVEEAKQQAIGLRYSAVEEKQQEKERQLLVHLAELDDEGDYTEEFLKPSKPAMEMTRNILLQAYRGFSDFSRLPKFVTADGDGGIRIQWQTSRRELRLLCSNEGELKLYWQDGEKYGLEKPTVTNLTARFEWLNEA